MTLVTEVETKDLVTKDTWHEYLENMSHTGFLDYISANEDFVGVLEHIIANSNSFKELKGGINALIRERKDFIDFANSHCP